MTRRHRLHCSALCVVLCIVASVRAEEPAPLPSVAQQQEAIKLVRDVYSADYAKKAPKDLQALASRLIKVGLEEEGAGKFAAFSEARDVAASAGYAMTAFKAIDALAGAFAGIDVPAMRVAALASAEKTATLPGSFAFIAESYLKLSDSALAGADLGAAVKYSISAEAASKRSSNADVTARAAQLRKDLKVLQPQFTGLDAARVKLATEPDDPAANLLAGKFLCLVVGDWENGLSNLSKGSDAALRDAALRDLNTGKTPAGRVGLGDAWNALAEKQTIVLCKQHLNARAAYWYELALPDLTGLQKAKAQMRLATIQPKGSNAPKAGDAPKGTVAASQPLGDATHALIAEIMHAAPAAMQPRSDGAAWDHEPLRAWCMAQGSKFELDATLVMEAVYPPSTRTPYVWLRSRLDEPLKINGVEYQIVCNVKITSEKDWPTFQPLARGDKVKVKGPVTELFLDKATWLGPKGKPVLLNAWLEGSKSVVTPVK
jgi:hypothetical protein